MSRFLGWAIALLSVLVGLFSVALTGEAAGLFGVPLAAALLWAVFRLPLRTSLFAVAFIALALDNPSELPHAGLWRPPWRILGQFFFGSLHNRVPVPFLRFSGLELVLVLMWGVVIYRYATRSTVDPPRVPVPRPLVRALLLSAGALLALEAYGVARGGNVKESIYQFRVILATVAASGLFLVALRSRQDLRLMGRLLVGAAMVKVLEGSFFYFVIRPTLDREPPYVTTHTDTVLFCLAIMALVVRWWESPRGRFLVQGLALSALITFGIVINDRRLAYVTLAGCLLAVLLISPWNRAKRFVGRVAVLSLPLVLVYFVVGWGSTSGVFKPVRTVRTILVSDTGGEEDSSTEFRDLENFNLIQTWAANPVMGSGFGHEFLEVAVLPDITRIMPNYKYEPHNAVLWLLGVGGVVGFLAVWWYLTVAVFLAGRTYHRAVDPLERAAALWSICAVVAYLNQAFGDMGTHSYTSAFTLGPAVGLVGVFATRVGAWPAPVASRQANAGLVVVQGGAPVAPR